ncbi:two-component response regulator [Erythrobacter litoralis]|uniref:Regulator n=1 Tax=Erythrobacter litoralis TaxID=39960 RepID=A0A074MDE6_9SPHN|nr:response regulator transcription factor [Erythrobacter litoralis]AOL22763.1 two-component response regulator [Erythrobacter litoralis]KEO89873.1 regulator [Erythrobacter litoralis]
MSGARVLIVDDHQLAREGLGALLAGKGYEVVGLAGTGEQAVELARDLAPEVVLMDVRLGEGIDGLEATRQIAALDLPVRVLMLSLHDMPGYVREALGAGAAGYVLKDTAIDDLCAAIEQVLAGQSALPLELVNAALRVAPATRQSLSNDLEQILTKREREVVELVAEGLTNKEIARQLGISPATVKVHVERLIGKLGVADRTQAAVLAVRLKAERAGAK